MPIGWNLFNFYKTNDNDNFARFIISNVTFKNFIFYKNDIFNILLKHADVSISNIEVSNCYFIESTFLRASETVRTSPRKKITLQNVNIDNTYFYESSLIYTLDLVKLSLSDFNLQNIYCSALGNL